MLSEKLISNKRFLHDLKSKQQTDSIDALTAIWGIGNWTAKMFLIFGLNKVDIFINEDLGIKKSIEKIYGKNFILKKLENEFKPFQKHCHIVTMETFGKIIVGLTFHLPSHNIY